MLFIIKRDKKGKFLFASLQSEFSLDLVEKGITDNNNLDTVIYQRGNSFYTKSTAAIEILSEIGGIWKIFGVFKLFPASFLDRIYDFIASHRYNWFGKKHKCMVPTAEIKARFLAK